MMHYLPFALPLLLIGGMELWQKLWRAKHRSTPLKNLTQAEIDRIHR